MGGHNCLGTGTAAADSSVSGNVGTLTNGPTWTTSGRVGGALSFDGTDDYVSVANEATYDITGSITVAAWIKVNAFDKAYQSILTKGDSWKLQRNNLTNTLSLASMARIFCRAVLLMLFSSGSSFIARSFSPFFCMS